MENDKNTDFDEDLGVEQNENSADSASRARNRTVMLTPEITGEVRARLQQDIESGSGSSGRVLGGFETPVSSGLPSPSSSMAAHQPRGQFQPAQPVQPAQSAPRQFAPAAPQPLAQQPVAAAAPAPGQEGAVWVKPSPLIGFLVSFDRDSNGSVFELRSGRLIVTSETPGGGNFLFVKDESVSPMHAIMRMGSEGDIQVLDQLSEFGTKIIRATGGEQEELSGDKSELYHGDIIQFGKRKFHVCIIVRNDSE